MLTIFRRINNKRYTASFLLLITTILLFSGCATQKYTPRYTTQTSTNKLGLEQKLRKYNLDKFMLLKDDFRHFKKGDIIQIKYVTSSLIKTDKGYIIPISKLMKIKKASTKIRQQDKPHKTKFSLIVNAPKGARVRIMNIKPKYKDGILLKKGKYHIKVTKSGFKTYDKWLKLYKNTKLNINLQKLKFVANGNITWKEDYKIDPYYYSVKNFNNYIWTDKKQSERSWAEANYYCKKLSININGTVLNDFKLPNENELKTLWKYRHYSSFYDNKDKFCSIWSGIEGKMRGYSRRVAKSFYLKRGDYSGWYYSCKGGCSHPDIDDFTCVYSKKLDLAYLGAVDLKKSKSLSINQIASQIYKSKIKYLSNPIMKKKPKKEKYHLMKKNEFETTKQFNIQVTKHRTEIDLKNKQNIEKWSIENKKIKKQFEQNLKKFQDNKNQHYIKILKQAQIIKYGNPKIKNTKYNADKEMMYITLTSTRGNYINKVQVPVKLKYAKKFKEILLNPKFKPIVEFSVIKNKLQFKSIEQIKDPELLVIEKEFKNASNSIIQLNNFLLKYSNSSFKEQAKSRITALQYKEFKASYNYRTDLKNFINKYPKSIYITNAKDRIKVLEEEERLYKIRRAEEDRKTKEKWKKERERKQQSYYAKKYVGEKVCKDGTTALILSITITAYVERVNGNNIQLRISDTEGTTPYMNGVTLYRNTLIWDDYSSWYKCNY